MHDTVWIVSGQVLALAATLISFWTAHSANKRRIEQAAEWRAQMAMKVDNLEKAVARLERWFEVSWGLKGSGGSN